MEITAIGCLHGFKPTLTGGDILIITGDLTARDGLIEHSVFLEWLHNQDYKKKILIAGNHDFFLHDNPRFYDKTGIDYLCDSGTEFEGYKIWGSPITPWFEGVNPKCSAFMRDRGEDIEKHWAKIPLDTNILVTHGPPYFMLDRTVEDKHVGCEELRRRLNQMGSHRPRYHIFSHIHEDYGRVNTEVTDFINCSLMDENYKPVNKPIRINI